jgi:hypothetical protein
MAVVKTATLNCSVSVTEDLAAAPAARGSVLSNQFDVGQRNLGAASTPVASGYAGWQPALAAGVLDIDLLALPGTQGVFSATGKKIVAFRLQNPNANEVAIQAGTSNGYNLFGASGKVVVPPGTTAAPGEVFLYLHSGGITIDATHKIISLAGTGIQAFSCEILVG